MTHQIPTRQSAAARDRRPAIPAQARRRSPAFRWAPRILAFVVSIGIGGMPAIAYTIFLKDGSRIEAREKYRIEDGRALIVLPNGATTFLNAAEIDVERTQGANSSDYGTAMVLEDGKVTNIEEASPPPPRETLGDLIVRGRTARDPVTAQPGSRRSGRATGASAGETETGFMDLNRLPRSPHPAADLVTATQREFAAAGLDSVSVYAGSASDRPMVEVTVDSEAEVFRALEATAAALLRLRQRQRIAAVELLLLTSDGGRAGQFALTTEEAILIAGDQVELSHFYVDRVQF